MRLSAECKPAARFRQLTQIKVSRRARGSSPPNRDMPSGQQERDMNKFVGTMGKPLEIVAAPWTPNYEQVPGATGG